MDPIAAAVAERVLDRSRAGMQKYGVGLTRDDLGVAEWLRHLQEELLDAANYVEVLIRKQEGVDAAAS